MSDLRLDWERLGRIGLPEAIFCAGKSREQIARIVGEARARGERLLLTRLEQAVRDELGAEVTAELDYDPVSRTGFLGRPGSQGASVVAVVCAGSSDLPVASEAIRTLAFHGRAATLVGDVGVAGLWRLMERLDTIRTARVVIAVAGMEGALFSVLGGLVAAPVIAVPTSVGYGVATEGRAALTSALATCAPGVVAVNIDNGYGAACAALRILGAAA